ncbi:leucyltransferase [Flavobacteriaceae bacterium UJ101]|nr:leucyltransferase [Flavobacteriaceae bacterium UJ101]
MKLKVLSDKIVFPSVDGVGEHGIVAIGGDLSVKRLKLAYQTGIFPWFNDDEPIMWWSPDPRFVLYPKDLKVSKSMRKILRNETFTITYNQNFKEVIQACQKIPREGQEGTWITDNMVKAYVELHKEGWAKSVEVWKDDKLVGGLYGIDLGNVFCGESMFSKVSNASKAGFITFIEEKLNQYEVIDCQIHTDHLESLGAKEIPRELFLSYLK